MSLSHLNPSINPKSHLFSPPCHEKTAGKGWEKFQITRLEFSVLAWWYTDSGCWLYEFGSVLCWNWLGLVETNGSINIGLPLYMLETFMFAVVSSPLLVVVWLCVWLLQLEHDFLLPDLFRLSLTEYGCGRADLMFVLTLVSILPWNRFMGIVVFQHGTTRGIVTLGFGVVYNNKLNVSSSFLVGLLVLFTTLTALFMSLYYWSWLCASLSVAILRNFGVFRVKIYGKSFRKLNTHEKWLRMQSPSLFMRGFYGSLKFNWKLLWSDINREQYGCVASRVMTNSRDKQHQKS